MFDCNQTVTIWNRWRDVSDKSSPDVFRRMILPVKCKFIGANKTAAADKGLIWANSFAVIIPFSELYRPPGEWRAICESDRERFFTLCPGDIIALGERFADAPPYKETELTRLFAPCCFLVKSVLDNTRSDCGRHFRAEG